ncbi:MAG: hypothetical protein COA79_03390 [Planctomycetota bacterium]|nr:MAG: hypothetical protein COA79_03390 [Planctomycetota bacterium]
MILNPRVIIESSNENSKIYPLNMGTNLIGRASNCHISIKNDEKISREHCAIIIQENEALLLDLGSGNGSKLNDQKIEKSSLTWGDAIQIGNQSLLFVYDKTTDNSEDETLDTSQTYFPTDEQLTHVNSSDSITATQTMFSQNQKNIFLVIANELTSEKSVDNVINKLTDELLNHFKLIGIAIKYMGHHCQKGDVSKANLKESFKNVILDNRKGIIQVPFTDQRGHLTLISENGFNQVDVDIIISLTKLITEICLNRYIPEIKVNKNTHNANNQLIGKSKFIQQAKKFIQKVGNTNAPILIGGSSGTGKEVIANLLHKEYSSTSMKPFVAVNCGAISPQIFESEFFGHIKGAFTGANENKSGYFEQAHGGTLFLDELGEMPLEFQAKLLRALETGVIRPVGSAQSFKTNVRIICATNRNLRDLIEEGLFRDDLYFRLQIIEFLMIPLKERKEDIPAIIEFLQKQQYDDYDIPIKSFLPDAITYLKNQPWPGNIRELKNVILRISTLADEESISQDTVKIYMKEKSDDEKDSFKITSLKEAESVHIKKILEHTDGNKTEAAKILGITRTTLYEKISKF